MKFSRLFYDSKTDLSKVSTNWVIISIVIGLLSSLTIYSFLHTFNEAFRIFSTGYDNSPIILSKSARNFYNLFFAGLSVVFGNSIALLCLFSKPTRFISRLNPLRKRVLNDQIFLNFSFSYWFVKIGFTLGIVSMCIVDVNFISSFKVYAYLLLVVLYLETWKAVSRTIPKHRLKIQLAHLVIVFGITLGLSRIDPINYKLIDNGLLKYNPIIDLPESNFYDEQIDYRHLRIPLKMELDNEGNLAIYNEYKERINLNELPSFILEEKSWLREELSPFALVLISADKNLNIRYIKKIEAELLAINQRKVLYVLASDDINSIYDIKGIKFRISESVFSLKDTSMIPLPYFRELGGYRETNHLKDTIKVDVGSVIKIRNSIVKKENLVNEFKRHINEDTLFEYSYAERTTYQDYIKVLSANCQAAFELRKENQTIFKEDEYNNYKLFREEQFKLKWRFPVWLTEEF